MSQEHQINEIQQLEELLSTHPTDSSIMSQLAIGYLNCREAERYEKAASLFKQAFELSPSVETATNYAYFLMIERREYEEGIELLRTFIDQKPKSLIPYNLIGFAYLCLENYGEAVDYFAQAMCFMPVAQRDIIHNFAFCKHHLGELKEAIELYDQAIALGDQYHQSLFNKALCQAELGHQEDVNHALKILRHKEAYQDPVMLSQLCYVNNNMEWAYELLMEDLQFSLLGYPELCYVLLQHNRPKFDELLAKQLEWYQSLIAETNDPANEDYDSYSEEERVAQSMMYQKATEQLKNLSTQLLTPPMVTPVSLASFVVGSKMLYD